MNLMTGKNKQLTDSQWLGKDDSLLVDCGGSHKLVPEVFAAFSIMQTAASEDGIDLQLVSCYRSFERQLSIWNRKWRGELPLYDIEDNLIDASSLDDNEKMHAILTWSALPGASRHHWGSDLDVYDKLRVEASGQPFNLIKTEYLENGPCYELASWLQNHAEDFGFTLPYLNFTGGVACEPWHLSFKPIADSVVKQLNLSVLAEALQQADLEGKHTVLNNLEEIFFRYTLNGQQL